MELIGTNIVQYKDVLRRHTCSHSSQNPNVIIHLKCEGFLYFVLILWLCLFLFVFKLSTLRTAIFIFFLVVWTYNHSHYVTRGHCLHLTLPKEPIPFESV